MMNRYIKIMLISAVALSLLCAPLAVQYSLAVEEAPESPAPDLNIVYNEDELRRWLAIHPEGIGTVRLGTNITLYDYLSLGGNIGVDTGNYGLYITSGMSVGSGVRIYGSGTDVPVLTLHAGTLDFSGSLSAQGGGTAIEVSGGYANLNNGNISGTQSFTYTEDNWEDDWEDSQEDNWEDSWEDNQEDNWEDETIVDEGGENPDTEPLEVTESTTPSVVPSVSPSTVPSVNPSTSPSTTPPSISPEITPTAAQNTPVAGPVTNQPESPAPDTTVPPAQSPSLNETTDKPQDTDYKENDSNTGLFIVLLLICIIIGACAGIYSARKAR